MSQEIFSQTETNAHGEAGCLPGTYRPGNSGND